MDLIAVGIIVALTAMTFGLVRLCYRLEVSE